MRDEVVEQIPDSAIAPDEPIGDRLRRERMISLGYCPNHTRELSQLEHTSENGLHEYRCPKCEFVFREREIAPPSST